MGPQGRPRAAERGKELNKVPAAGVGEESEGKVRAGARGRGGVGNQRERTSCARRRMRAGGGRRTGREGEREAPAGNGAASAPAQSSCSSEGAAPPLPAPPPRFSRPLGLGGRDQPRRGLRVRLLGGDQRWLGRGRTRSVRGPRPGSAPHPFLSPRLAFCGEVRAG